MARNANEVRRLSDLPKWFDLSKYKNASTLDHAGWYKNLCARKNALKLLNSTSFKQMLQKDSQNENMKGIMSGLKSIRNTPVFSDSSFKGKSPWLFHAPIYTEFGVQQMTVYDLYFAGSRIEEAKQKYARIVIAAAGDGEDYYNALLWTEQEKEWKTNPMDDVLSASLIKVNLKLPENMLVEQFRAYLKKLNGKAKKVEKLEFDKWIKFGVLPYLDLKIWELESGETIINRVMADAIFPSGEGGEDAVRKTTAKLAKELLTNEHLDKFAEIAGAI
ncbi:MAG: DUF6387 family protein [Gallionella sp.]|nr:hypothetical protein [Gallionella sp.]